MKAFLTAGLLLVAAVAHADAVDALREFVRDAKSGRATFTQVVTAPDGAKKKTSSGNFEFARPNRFRFAYARPFEQLIVADRRYTLDDHRAIQLDVLSLRAAADLARFRDWTAADPSVERARRILADWDARLTRDNAAAALWATWAKSADGDREATLARAVERLTREQGADPSAWRWGRMHAQAFRHPVTAAFDAGIVERGGGLGTVADDGASYRQILDPAIWDRSIVTNTPGQSGQPQSPFYGNLLPLWAEDLYFPLVFSAARVEAETTNTLVLEPR
jgi:acyl-homoserine lactone acylase PvdQ